jgi:hypothetical protein
MEYLIPLVLVLLLVGGFVAFMVLNATRRGQKSDASREASGTPGIGPDDETPLGDTSEHAGEQTSEGRTVGGQDADEKGGTGRPVQSGYTGTSAAGRDDSSESAHVRRSGEGEGTERVAFEDVEPPAARDRREAAAEREAGAQAAGERERAGSDEARDEESRPESERLADRGF